MEPTCWLERIRKRSFVRLRTSFRVRRNRCRRRHFGMVTPPSGSSRSSPKQGSWLPHSLCPDPSRRLRLFRSKKFVRKLLVASDSLLPGRSETGQSSDLILSKAFCVPIHSCPARDGSSLTFDLYSCSCYLLIYRISNANYSIEGSSS